ncbi:MAG TPA: phosphodiester glycosidase family protein [Vicinamibacterales bacterium]|nr:phosphodiester glycosidase family protein [Vicinamibacterales bacterium]
MSYYPAMRLLAILITLVSQPFAGITYIDRTETSPRAVHMHIVQVDLSAPGLRFKLSPPSGGREVIRQSTLDYLAQEGAQVAINAHFFLPFPSPDREAWLIGIAASEGRVYSTFEAPEQSFALVRDAAALNIDRENHAAIVHRRLRRGFGGQGADDGTEVVEPVTLWTTVSGSAQIVTDGVKTVPGYKDAAHPEALLDQGGPGTFSNQKSWYDVATARTAIGLSRDGRTLTLFTVDVRGGSDGMRVGEVADLLMADYGVWNALNLDGGGSTSMAMEDPATHVRSMVNVSSDRDNPGGRSVGSSLAVFAPAFARVPH